MNRSASRTARERARTELTREIKQEARRQLAAHGAQGLSLRAVARELGIPAVVGTGNATMRLHDGDHIRVDGEHGTVERRPSG